MRQIVLILLSVLSVGIVSAQSETTDSMSIDAAFNACIAMRDAVANNDSVAIKQSAIDLKAAGTTNFSSLRCKDDSIASLNGHLVFDEIFADSLAEGKDVYRKADDMNSSKAHRGQTADGSILTKTCFVKAGKSTKYSFASKGHQELAVVAEAGGLVTMKVHVTNTAGLDKRFDDTKNVKIGMPQRKTSFELPTDRRNTVELEIVNCGNKDCSFVVISN
jgi:predicted enzyme related to lactoylglutathione lyase